MMRWLMFECEASHIFSSQWHVICYLYSGARCICCEQHVLSATILLEKMRKSCTPLVVPTEGTYESRLVFLTDFNVKFINMKILLHLALLSRDDHLKIYCLRWEHTYTHITHTHTHADIHTDTHTHTHSHTHTHAHISLVVCKCLLHTRTNTRFGT